MLKQYDIYAICDIIVWVTWIEAQDRQCQTANMRKFILYCNMSMALNDALFCNLSVMKWRLWVIRFSRKWVLETFFLVCGVSAQEIWYVGSIKYSAFSTSCVFETHYLFVTSNDWVITRACLYTKRKKDANMRQCFPSVQIFTQCLWNIIASL